MNEDYKRLKKVQQLALDLIKVNRNHFIVGTNRYENVVEHSFSLLMLCWKIFEAVKPPLNIEKIFKYALVHDFMERGLTTDTNTYGTQKERELKKEREAIELKKLSVEFKDFEDMIHCLHSYEHLSEEALFVWSVDKMQAMILGDIDNWRPYANHNVSYEQFCSKSEEFIKKCSPYVKDIFEQVFTENKKTYYDSPVLKA